MDGKTQNLSDERERIKVIVIMIMKKEENKKRIDDKFLQNTEKLMPIYINFFFFLDLII